MRVVLTTILDALGLLLVAAGAGALAYRWIGLAALGVAGVVVLAGSAVASRPPRRSDQK
jgi:hypothetical protein